MKLSKTITAIDDGMTSLSTDLVRRLGEDSLLPEIRGQVAVGRGDGIKGGLGCKVYRQVSIKGAET